MLPNTWHQIIILTGHYGVGKTTVALNLALEYAAAGERVVLVDLDIVNPYFRSSEYRELLERSGVSLISPVCAQKGTSLDTPSLSGTVYPAIHEAQAGRCRLIIDSGGDDAGATALGRFRADLIKAPYSFLYVVNACRAAMGTPADAAAVLQEIQAVCGLNPTGIINNTHLMDATDEAVLQRGLAFARDSAQLSGLPVELICVPSSCADGQFSLAGTSFATCALQYVREYVVAPWSDSI